MQNGSSVGKCTTHCILVFAHLSPTCMLSRCLSTKLLHRSSVSRKFIEGALLVGSELHCKNNTPSHFPSHCHCYILQVLPHTTTTFFLHPSPHPEKKSLPCICRLLLLLLLPPPAEPSLFLLDLIASIFPPRTPLGTGQKRRGEEKEPVSCSLFLYIFLAFSLSLSVCVSRGGRRPLWATFMSQLSLSHMMQDSFISSSSSFFGLDKKKERKNKEIFFGTKVGETNGFFVVVVAAAVRKFATFE